jgi:hypothetical protein
MRPMTVRFDLPCNPNFASNKSGYKLYTSNALHDGHESGKSMLRFYHKAGSITTSYENIQSGRLECNNPSNFLFSSLHQGNQSSVASCWFHLLKTGFI